MKMLLLLWCADNLDMLEMVGDVDRFVLTSLLHNIPLSRPGVSSV